MFWQNSFLSHGDNSSKLKRLACFDNISLFKMTKELLIKWIHSIVTFILIFPVETSFLFERFVFPYENTVQKEQSILTDWDLFFCREENNRGYSNCFARLHFRNERSQFSLPCLEYHLDSIPGMSYSMSDSGNPMLLVIMFFRSAGAFFRWSLFDAKAWLFSLPYPVPLLLVQESLSYTQSQIRTPKCKDVPMHSFEFILLLFHATAFTVAKLAGSGVSPPCLLSALTPQHTAWAPEQARREMCTRAQPQQLQHTNPAGTEVTLLSELSLLFPRELKRAWPRQSVFSVTCCLGLVLG